MNKKCIGLVPLAGDPAVNISIYMTAHKAQSTGGLSGPFTRSSTSQPSALGHGDARKPIYTRSSRHALALSPLFPHPLPHPPTTGGGGGGGDNGNMVQRLTYRKRHSYATKSNQTRVVKTPGTDSLLLLLSI